MKNIYHAVIPDSHTVRHLPALMMIIKESNLDLILQQPEGKEQQGMSFLGTLGDKRRQ